MQRFLIYHLYNSKVMAFNFLSEDSAQEFVKTTMTDTNPELLGIFPYTKLDDKVNPIYDASLQDEN